MTVITIHEAKTHLSRLIKEALTGEEILIARGKQPLVKLVPLPKAKITRQLGGAKGVIKYMPDDFNAPVDDFQEYME